MKKRWMFGLLLVLAVLLLGYGVSRGGRETQPTPTPTARDVPSLTPVLASNTPEHMDTAEPPSDTPTGTATERPTATNTLPPAPTKTPTPAPTKKSGGSGATATPDGPDGGDGDGDG